MIENYLKRLRRRKSRLRRFFNGKLPHWINDLSSILGYLNFFALIPTFLYLICAPEHFFKRLPKVLSGHSMVHKTPLKFVSSTITLELFVNKFFFNFSGNSQDGHISLSGYLYNFSHIPEFIRYLIEPIATLITTILLVPFYVFTSLVVILPLAYGIRFLPGFYDIKKDMSLYVYPLKPGNYKGIRRGQYFWGLFYINLSQLVISSVIGVIYFLVVLSVLYFVDNFREGWGDIIGFTLIGLSILSLSFVYEKAILSPYIQNIKCAKN